ncbi:MAG: YigZ family protein [Methanobrevibacter sp.]|jgi:uncharacterized YigZ family protein|nr:YigZ family protein [Candidatus Methanoflexus mossambicus]
MKSISEITKKEIVIKKSRFICHLFPVKNAEKIKKTIKETSDKYKDATHNCTAYIITNGEGSDDDGEPGGTAGRPMLNVLKKNDLNNILAIVTRYFGGVKLGAGGLVRAYSKAVQETLNISKIIELELYEIYEVIFDYNDIKTVENKIRENNLNILKKEYNEKIRYKIASKKKNNEFKTIFNSKIDIKHLKQEYLSI